MVAAVMGLAAFTQSLVGFGLALVAMPILANVLVLEVASPMVAMCGLVNSFCLWRYYRQSLRIDPVLRLLSASILGIPVGLYALHVLPRAPLLVGLGGVIASYALYSLLGARLPELRSPNWGFGFGFVAGMLSGSYNIPGPPVVLYGQCCRWSPAEFKGSLTGYFWCNTVAVLVGHGLQGRITGAVVGLWAIALIPLLLGFGLGIVLSRRINPNRFRTLVFGGLLLSGMRLVGVGLQGA